MKKLDTRIRHALDVQGHNHDIFQRVTRLEKLMFDAICNDDFEAVRQLGFRIDDLQTDYWDYTDEWDEIALKEMA